MPELSPLENVMQKLEWVAAATSTATRTTVRPIEARALLGEIGRLRSELEQASEDELPVVHRSQRRFPDHFAALTTETAEQSNQDRPVAVPSVQPGEAE